jgi:hypothetical protein
MVECGGYGNNMHHVQKSRSLRDGSIALVERCGQMAELMVDGSLGERQTVRMGRKAHELDTRARLLGSTDLPNRPEVSHD